MPTQYRVTYMRKDGPGSHQADYRCLNSAKYAARLYVSAGGRQRYDVRPAEGGGMRYESWDGEKTAQIGWQQPAG